MELATAVRDGTPLEDIERLLRAAPAAALAADQQGKLPLHVAAFQGRTDVVRLLLAAAPATATATAAHLFTPLHCAAFHGHADTVSLLLEAAPAAALARDANGRTPLHYAAFWGRRGGAAQALLAAAPGAAAVRDSNGDSPLHAAVRGHSPPMARLLLSDPDLYGTADLAAALAECGDAALPLYADLAASRPLTVAQWAIVPAPCPALVSALPAVVARSRAEARLLVQHLTTEQWLRLRTLALCVARAQHRAGVSLPADLIASLLASAAAASLHATHPAPGSAVGGGSSCSVM